MHLEQTADIDTVSTYQVSSVQLVTDKKLDARGLCSLLKTRYCSPETTKRLYGLQVSRLRMLSKKEITLDYRNTKQLHVCTAYTHAHTYLRIISFKCLLYLIGLF